MRFLAMGAALLALSACATREEVVQDHAKSCQTEYGAKAGTPEFTQCMLTLDQIRMQRKQAMADGMQSASNRFYASANRSRQCRTTPGYNGSYNTSCN